MLLFTDVGITKKNKKTNKTAVNKVRYKCWLFQIVIKLCGWGNKKQHPFNATSKFSFCLSDVFLDNKKARKKLCFNQKDRSSSTTLRPTKNVSKKGWNDTIIKLRYVAGLVPFPRI